MNKLQKLKKLIKVFVPKAVYPFANSIIYAGNRVECPVCSGHFRKFLPREEKKGIFCPRCGTKPRHRLLWLYFNDRTNLFADNLKLLHFAPEKFFQKKFKALANLDYTSADLYSPLAMVKQDIRELTFEDNAFDVILCSHVLEHIDQDRKAIAELFRVLRPGGLALVQVPIDINREVTYEDPNITTPEERDREFWQYDHVRLYGRDFHNRLEEAGFEVTVDGYVRELDPSQIARLGLSEHHDIYYCRKPSN